MLMAVEMWMKRDHDAEWKTWMARLDHVAKRVETIPGVTTSVKMPEGLSNKHPTLNIRWDAAKLGVTGRAVARHLFTTEPRIALPTGAGDSGLAVVPYMMLNGEEKIVADRLYATITAPPKAETTPSTAAPVTDLSGRWDVRIDFLASSSEHVLHLKQQADKLEGTHQGDFLSRDLSGAIHGNEVRIASSVSERHGDSLQYEFTGTLQGEQLSGTLSMGEYLGARFTAKRHTRG